MLPSSGEYLARHADGTVEPYSVHFSLLRDDAGQPSQVIACARNISAERRAEQERSQVNVQDVHHAGLQETR